MLIEKTEGQERRTATRAIFREPVSFRFSEEEGLGGCLGQDISARGLRINFNHFVRPGTNIAFQFRLNGSAALVTLQGRVAWALRVPCSDRYQLGIEFTDINSTNQDNIRQYAEMSAS